ncbi:MAG: general secretion pathway protein GspK [Planctomycetes bacterium]|nr:general secretion pathway protein GspK [Planctomycetota bacterium]MBI3844876.1 general secretion pathway protein GspK [Planctomycetota bacterium]
MKATSPSGRENERGIALLLTLLVLTILLIIAVQLAYSTKIAFGLAKDRRNEMQIDLAFRGDVFKAQAILRYDQSQGETDSKKDDWQNPDFSDPDDAPTSQGQQGTEELADEEPQIRGQIVDEDSKYNLVHLLPRRPNAEMASDDKDPQNNKDNANGEELVGKDQPKKDLKDKPREKPFDEQKEKERHARAIHILMSIIDEFRQGTPYDVTPGDAKEIAEGIDQFLNRSDSGHGGNGVDRMQTKSGLPLSLDELLLVPGVSENLMWDFRDPDDPNEIVPGLSNYVTIWSSGKINVNTAAEVVLRALFDDNHRDNAHDITTARGDEEELKENDRLRSMSKDARKEERAKKKIEERRKRKRQAKGGDLFGGDDKASDKGDNSDENGPFQEVGEIQKKNIVTNEDYQKILPYLSVKSDVFSLFLHGKKGHTTKDVRVVLHRTDEGKCETILWETRRVAHLSGVDLESEDDGQGGGFF